MRHVTQTIVLSQVIIGVGDRIGVDRHLLVVSGPHPDDVGIAAPAFSDDWPRHSPVLQRRHAPTPVITPDKNASQRGRHGENKEIAVLVQSRNMPTEALVHFVIGTSPGR